MGPQKCLTLFHSLLTYNQPIFFEFCSIYFADTSKLLFPFIKFCKGDNSVITGSYYLPSSNLAREIIL